MTRPPLARITGLGASVPDTIVTNRDLEARLDTSDQWIADRTGIRERRVAGPEVTLASLCIAACQQAMTAAGATADEIGAIILATTTPDRPLPACACDIQVGLGAFNAVAFDVHAACAGFIIALSIGEGLIAGGRHRKVLVIGGEKLSTITNWEDRSTAILFADGAGAVVLEAAEADGRGILSSYTRSDGRLAPLLCIPGGGNIRPISAEVLNDRAHLMQMNGREVFKHAVREMASACDIAMAQAGITGTEVDWLVPHQANLRIIDATAKHVGMPMDKVVVNVDRMGNTSSASVPIALAEAVADGRVTPGSTLLLAAFGAGFTWGAMVVKW
jgi:3-oxoacyl-[acyl-carrier-protein] synthase-3